MSCSFPEFPTQVNQVTLYENTLSVNPGCSVMGSRPVKVLVEFNPSRVLVLTQGGKCEEVKPYDIDFPKNITYEVFNALLNQGVKLGVSRYLDGDFRVYFKGLLLGGGQFSTSLDENVADAICNPMSV